MYFSCIDIESISSAITPTYCEFGVTPPFGMSGYYLLEYEMSRVTRSNEYQIQTPSANADASTHAYAYRWMCVSTRLPKIGPPDWNCRLSCFRRKGRCGIWEREGAKGNRRGRVPDLLVVLAHPSKASFRRRWRRHEGAAPRLPCYRRRDDV